MQLKEGSILQNGKYRIIRVLGQGGFGITYLAENMFLDKQVAIKEFFPKELCGRDNTSHLTLGTQNNAETVEKLKSRFLKEAKNIAKLDYPGIVKIHDVFEENNTVYYVMDYIEGISLADMVKVNGPLPESKAIGYVIKVGDALEYIHSRQMTHFDVKPANIMVRKSDDTPILIDFGLSKQYDTHGDATSTIMQGVSHGFSPIELYSANSVATFSPQTDVYSLGATLFFLLTGTVPPSASQVLEEGLKFPADISPDIRSAIKRAMSANRTMRYESVRNFCSDLSNDNRANINHSISSSEDTFDEETRIITNQGNISENTKEPESAGSISEEDGQGHGYDIEPSRWDKIVTWICGTNNLVNADKIPNSKKDTYLVLLIFLIIAAGMFPIGGWLLIAILYKYIRNSLQRVLFADYLDEFDDAYDYSKGKAITILILILSIPIAFFFLIVPTSKHDNKKEVTEYVTQFSTGCPFNIYDVQVSSASYVNGDIILTLHSSDSIHFNRDYLNELNFELLKPLFIDKGLIHHTIAKNNKITFKFYNNGIEMKPITLTPTEVEKYEKTDSTTRGKAWIKALIELENYYLPQDLGANVKITDVSIENIASHNGNYLTYTFVDNDRIMKKEFGDSLNYKIPQFLPLNIPYIGESVANALQGIGFKIYSGNNVIAEDVLISTSDIKRILSHAQE